MRDAAGGQVGDGREWEDGGLTCAAQSAAV